MIVIFQVECDDIQGEKHLLLYQSFLVMKTALVYITVYRRSTVVVIVLRHFLRSQTWTNITIYILAVDDIHVNARVVPYRFHRKSISLLILRMWYTKTPS